jgi:LmbE family N-acetylglucosaminyl deacetylase
MQTDRRLLVIAPHPDDEILGVGGTMARFAHSGGQVTVLTVAAHKPPLYPPEVHA